MRRGKILVLAGVLLTSVLIFTMFASSIGLAKGLVVYSVCWTEDPFWVASVDAAEEMVEHLGYDFKAFNAANENLRQVEQLSDVLALDPDAVIISAVDSRGIVGPVKKIKAEGIPVVVIVRTLTEAGTIDFTAKASMYGCGQKAAINLLNLLWSKYGLYEGTVLEIMGELADNATVDFHAGFAAIMQQFPDVKIEAKEAKEWSFERGADIAEDWLTAHPDTDAIYCHSDWLTQAIPPVLKRLGYKPAGEEPHIFVLSSGAMPFGLPYVKEGYIDMTTEIPILKTSKIAAYWAVQLAEGKSIPDKVHLIEPGMSLEWLSAYADVVQEPWGPTIEVPGAVIGPKNVGDPTVWGNIYQ